MTFGVDIEPTNRCNAKCYFCPRDATPHQGLMTPEVFEQSLGRCDELRTKLRALGRPELKISLCGLGEPLLNRHTPSFVRQVRDEGFDCTMSSNAALLDEAARATRCSRPGCRRSPSTSATATPTTRRSTSSRSNAPATTSCGSRSWPATRAR